MDLFTQFATDDNLEINGAWHKHGSGRFLIARAQNRKYQRLLAKRIEENQDVLNAGTDEADVRSEQIMAEIYAETILLGWDGEHSYNKQPLGEYTREKAVKLLLHKEFRKWVNKRADDLDAYRAKTETAQGNA
jgi:hypothetical protein